jgi:hypothetical protein
LLLVQKIVLTPPPAGDAIAVKNGVVVFKDFNAYKGYITMENAEERSKIYHYLNTSSDYQNLGERLQERGNNSGSTTARWNQPTGIPGIDAKIGDLLEDTAFVSILNQDGIVEIGDYRIQYNPFTDKVLVLHRNHFRSSYQALLDKDESNPNIFVFTVDDDVLDYFTDNNYPTTPPVSGNVLQWPEGARRLNVAGGNYGPAFPALCTTNPLFDRTVMEPRCSGTDIVIYGHAVVYRKYGIRFLLFTRMSAANDIESITMRGLVPVAFHRARYEIWFHPRRGNDDRRNFEAHDARGVAFTRKTYHNGWNALMRLRFYSPPNQASSGYPTSTNATKAVAEYPEYLFVSNY